MEQPALERSGRSGAIAGVGLLVLIVSVGVVRLATSLLATTEPSDPVITAPPIERSPTGWVSLEEAPEPFATPWFALIEPAGREYEGAEFAVLGREVASQGGGRVASLALVTRQPLASADTSPLAEVEVVDGLFGSATAEAGRTDAGLELRHVARHDGVDWLYRVLVPGLNTATAFDIGRAVRPHPDRLVVDEVAGLSVLDHGRRPSRSRSDAESSPRTEVRWRSEFRELAVVSDPGALPGVAGLVAAGHWSATRGLISGREAWWDGGTGGAQVVTTTAAGAQVFIEASHRLSVAQNAASRLVDIGEAAWLTDLPLVDERPEPPSVTTGSATGGSGAGGSATAELSEAPASADAGEHPPIPRDARLAWPGLLPANTRLTSHSVEPNPAVRIRIVAVHAESGEAAGAAGASAGDAARYRLGATIDPMPALVPEAWGSPLELTGPLEALDGTAGEGWTVAAHRAGDELHLRRLPQDPELAGSLTVVPLDLPELGVELVRQAAAGRWQPTDATTLVSDFFATGGHTQFARWRVLPTRSMEMRYSGGVSETLVRAVSGLADVTLLSPELGVWRVVPHVPLDAGFADAFVRPLPFGSIELRGDADPALMLDVFGSIDVIGPDELAAELEVPVVESPGSGHPS